ncbi:MAG TPA: ABC transporter permease subunit [Dermatophilaceae bacterium]|nr:ABC transporter permease subunit [Dermatophilaceae bacterium]
MMSVAHAATRRHAAVPAAGAQLWLLFARSLADRWRSLLAWAVGLAAIAAVQLTVYPSVSSSRQEMQAFVDQWPEAFREAFGLDAYASGPGYLNAELFSMVVPFVLVGVAIGAAAAATAGEEERGTADLLLSLPVTRGRVLLAKTLVMVTAVAVVAVSGWVVLVVGCPLVDLSIDSGDLAGGFAMAALLGVLYGAVALLVGALSGSRALALGAGVGLALAAFLLDALAPMADWLESWQQASPFDWAFGNSPLLQGSDGVMALRMVGVTLLLLALAHLAFRRRDVTTR